MNRWAAIGVAVGFGLGLGCEKPKPAEPPSERRAGAMPAPKPIAPLIPERVFADGGSAPRTDGGTASDDDDGMFQVKPFTPHGKAAPAQAVKLELIGDAAAIRTDAGRKVISLDSAGIAELTRVIQGGPVLLTPSDDTYLAQVAGLLAALDDAKVEVWLQHPSAPFAYRMTLQDEPAYQAWLDEPGPGRVRVIQRADGYEVTTALGKLLGYDPNGPTVPVRGGKQDLATLQKGLDRVKERFKEAKEIYFVPSYGTELAALARTVSANWLDDQTVIFAEQRWVYPRPKKVAPKDGILDGGVP